MKKSLFLIIWQTLTLFLAISASFPGFSSSSKYDFLTISQEPTSTQWQYFFEMTENDREALWNYHLERKRELRNWSWQWRIAWIRSCSLSQRSYCGKIMAIGLTDEAIVVRGEAASRIGDRFAGTEGQFPLAARLLTESYQNPGNDRNGEPLFIKFRILEALKKIGGKDALERAAKIAQSSSMTKTYWEKLQHN